MNFITKLKFLQKKQPVIIVAGKNRLDFSRAITDVLKHHFKDGKEFLIFESKLKDIKNLELFLKTSRKPLLVVTRVENISEENFENILEFIKSLSATTNLILNYDDEKIKRIVNFPDFNTFTFGFKEGADFRVSDIKSNGGINFKINYQGKVIPFWLRETVTKEQIYSVLCAAVVAKLFDLNLVEISQTFK